MSFSEERKILEKWFASVWGSNTAPNNTANVPCYHEAEVPEEPPDGPFMEMYILDGEGTTIEIGDPALNRYVGIIQFNLSLPIKTSVGPNNRAREIADALDALWNGRRFQTTRGWIRCRVPGYHSLGVQGGRFVAVVSVPYLRDKFADIPAAVPLT